MNPKRKPLLNTLLVIWLICLIIRSGHWISLSPYAEAGDDICFVCILVLCLEKPKINPS